MTDEQQLEMFHRYRFDASDIRERMIREAAAIAADDPQTYIDGYRFTVACRRTYDDCAVSRRQYKNIHVRLIPVLQDHFSAACYIAEKIIREQLEAQPI